MTEQALAPPQPLLLNRIAVGITFLFVLCLPLFAANFRIDRNPVNDGPLAGDFLQEYLGAYIILHGDYQRFYDLDYALALQRDPAVMGTTVGDNSFLPMIYPPFYYLLVAPVAWLPYYTAAVVWLFLMAGCLGLTVWLLARTYPEHPTLSTWALAGALLFVPLLEDLCSDQKATVVLLILTSTFLLLDRGRPLLAGLVFGLLAFKPQLTLVIGCVMMCKGQGRFVLGGAITGAALVGLSLLVSTDVCAQYLQISQVMAEYIDRGGFPLAKMHCWYGFWKLLLPGQDLALIQSITVLTGIATVAALARLLWGRFHFGRPAFALQFAGMVVATVLLSPHLLTYDLTMLLLPFFLLTHVFLTQSHLLACRQSPVVWASELLYVVAGVSTTIAAHTHVQATVPILFVFLATLAHPIERLSTSVPQVR